MGDKEKEEDRSKKPNRNTKVVAVEGPKDKRWHSFLVKDVKFTVDVKYKPHKVKGAGAYGCVCSALDSTTKKAVAIKKVTDAFADLVDARRVLREVKLLRHFDHENIISLVDMIEPSEGPLKDLYLVMDLMDTDLSQVIRTKTKEVTNAHIQYFVYQILRGLKYIHSAGVIHRDLKPANILVMANCDLKICDFGLAKHMSDSLPLTEYVVTRWYRAPEVMCAAEYSEKIDVWGLGCIVGELLGKKPMFPGIDYISQMELIVKKCGSPNEEDMEAVTNDKAAEFIRTLPKSNGIRCADLFPDADPDCIDLLEKMLYFDPRKRITVDEAMAHPYLANLTDWEDLHSNANKYLHPHFFKVLDILKRVTPLATFPAENNNGKSSSSSSSRVPISKDPKKGGAPASPTSPPSAATSLSSASIPESDRICYLITEYWQGIDFTFETQELTKANLVREFWEEIFAFRPHLRGAPGVVTTPASSSSASSQHPPQPAPSQGTQPNVNRVDVGGVSGSGHDQIYNGNPALNANAVAPASHPAVSAIQQQHSAAVSGSPNPSRTSQSLLEVPSQSDAPAGRQHSMTNSKSTDQDERVRTKSKERSISGASDEGKRSGGGSGGGGNTTARAKEKEKEVPKDVKDSSATTSSNPTTAAKPGSPSRGSLINLWRRIGSSGSGREPNPAVPSSATGQSSHAQASHTASLTSNPNPNPNNATGASATQPTGSGSQPASAASASSSGGFSSLLRRLSSAKLTSPR